jgi:NSS family neurotransmitter:Na+ symporter
MTDLPQPSNNHSPSEPGNAGKPRRWSSRYAFLMTSIGAAVGLGNLWRFPFQAGENGGSAFVFVYLVCIVVVVYPVLMA